jgi:hypothetical protein
MMQVYRCPLSVAQYHVSLWHRHAPGFVQGHKFSLAAYKNGVLVGVAIVGRPIARGLDDGHTLEVRRVSTDGTRNACSALLGEARRRAVALQVRRLITYTFPGESGASLRAVNATCFALRSRGDWQTRNGRRDGPTADQRWELLPVNTESAPKSCDR